MEGRVELWVLAYEIEKSPFSPLSALDLVARGQATSSEVLVVGNYFGLMRMVDGY